MLFIDPQNPAGLLLKDTLQDVIIYREWNQTQRAKTLSFAQESNRINESLVIPKEMLAYPSDWPEISFRRGGAETFAESPEDRRVHAELDGVRILGRKTVELMMTNHLNHLSRPTTGGDDSNGFGLGGRVRIDLARGNLPGSLGQFGWSGAATTYFDIDPKEKTMILLFAQHFPYNQHGIFEQASTLVYASLVD